MSWKSMHGDWEAKDEPIQDLGRKLCVIAIWPGIPLGFLIWIFFFK